MARVYIVNKSNHDYTAAKSYGSFIFLSEGKMSRYEPNNMMREFAEKMQQSEEGDYLLLCGLSVMNVVASVIFAVKHRRLNLLLFKNGRYLERNVVFGELM